jgi:hypothetical protein
MFFVIAWWLISARKWFKGPVINVEHHMIGRDEIVEGIEHYSTSDAHSIPDRKPELEAASAPTPSELQ